MKALLCEVYEFLMIFFNEFSVKLEKGLMKSKFHVCWAVDRLLAQILLSGTQSFKMIQQTIKFINYSHTKKARMKWKLKVQ